MRLQGYVLSRGRITYDESIYMGFPVSAMQTFSCWKTLNSAIAAAKDTLERCSDPWYSPTRLLCLYHGLNCNRTFFDSLKRFSEVSRLWREWFRRAPSRDYLRGTIGESGSRHFQPSPAYNASNAQKASMVGGFTAGDHRRSAGRDADGRA